MTRTQGYLIGIDGGGTGCRVAIASPDATLLSTAKGGPANVRTDREAAVKNVTAAIHRAVDQAGLTPEILKTAYGCGGLAGVHTADLGAKFAAALPVARMRIIEDRDTTLTGALGHRDGALAAIGTGSFIGHTTGGQTRYLGGWGFDLGDQASGAWLGKQLLIATLLAFDAVDPPTKLTRATLETFDGDPRQIYEFGTTATPADYARYAPAITAAATAGDATAKRLMATGAAYISKSLITLGYTGQTPLCLTGGVGPHYRAWLPPRFAAAVTPPLGTALDGALALAGEMAAETTQG
jgi:glucosamine kinase